MRSDKEICITSYGSISPLGSSSDEVRSSYSSSDSAIRVGEISGKEFLVASLSQDSELLLDQIASQDRRYAALDKSVLMAIYAARQCHLSNSDNKRTLVTIGSSRGATSVWERSHKSFIESGKTPVLTSPTTTLGNISSWVAQDLGVGPYAISHSMTCSTALEAIANGIAWLKGGLCERVIAGGSEAPLTPFTIAQMKALSIYADSSAMPYPCTPMASQYQKGAGMVLGEGAAVFVIELKDRESIEPKRDIIIDAIGFGSEDITHATSISSEGDCLYGAMLEASGQKLNEIDGVVVHAPGTEAGDRAEYNAVQRLFKNSQVKILSNKWRIGHTLGASGAFSLEYAILLLQGVANVAIPYSTRDLGVTTNFNRLLVNSAGFGGHAISLLIAQI